VSKLANYILTMNKLPALACALALIFTAGCEQQPQTSQEDVEKEVQRRVEDRLAEERRVQQEQQLKEREQQLADREKEIADREAAEQQRRDREAAAAATPEPAPAPEPVAESAPLRGVPVDDGEPSATTQSFYDELDPHGDWIETPDYGYVFRPGIVARDVSWRPYEDGRWGYTEDGWTWVSNEPFGWATYHYGRWTRLNRFGWVWVPGTEWAPAWVSWRYGDDYCGWAPLPPEARFGSGISISFDVAGGYGALDYVFVPTISLCESSIRRHIVDRRRNVTIINRTVNVTHIERRREHNKTVITNRGPHITRVEAAMKKPVPRLKLERRQGPDRRTQIQGDTVQISAPAPRRAVDQPKPRRVKERISKADSGRAEAIATPVAVGTPQAEPAAPPSRQPRDRDDRSRDKERLLQPFATPQPAQVQTPQEAQRKAVEKEQDRQRRLIEQKRRPREGGQSAQPDTTPAERPVGKAGQPVEIQQPVQTQTPVEAQREAVQREQQRQQRLIEQQQQLRQQRLEKQQAGEERLRLQRNEEQQAREQQARQVEKQREQAERGQLLQQRRAEQQERLEQQRSQQEQRRQEIQQRQQSENAARQEAAAQRAQQQAQQREARPQKQEDSRKRKGDKKDEEQQ
jgi:hypothetical protein